MDAGDGERVLDALMGPDVKLECVEDLGELEPNGERMEGLGCVRGIGASRCLGYPEYLRESWNA